MDSDRDRVADTSEETPREELGSTHTDAERSPVDEAQPRGVTVIIDEDRPTDAVYVATNGPEVRVTVSPFVERQALGTLRSDLERAVKRSVKRSKKRVKKDSGTRLAANESQST